MKREIEPELMEEVDQAVAYAEADFDAPHSAFMERFQQLFPSWSGRGQVLDLGCGPGDITKRFARAYPHCRVDGIDGAEAMLAEGRRLLAQEPGLSERVRLYRACLPQDRPPEASYDAVISNSLLHHLADPLVLWSAVEEYGAPGAPVFVVDLMRPADRAEAERLTALYSEGEPDVLRRDFFHSLLAAFTAEEVLDGIQIYRHWISGEAGGFLGFLAEYASALWGEWWLAWKAWRRHRFKVIHLCNPPDLLFLVAWPFKLLGVKIIYDVHDLWPEMFEEKFKRRGLMYWCVRLAERLTYACANTVLTTNESVRHVALTRGRKPEDRVFVVRTSPKIGDLDISPDLALKKGRPYLVGFVGVMGDTGGVR